MPVSLDNMNKTVSKIMKLNNNQFVLELGVSKYTHVKINLTLALIALNQVNNLRMTSFTLLFPLLNTCIVHI